jgi:hypothetical protein
MWSRRTVDTVDARPAGTRHAACCANDGVKSGTLPAGNHSKRNGRLLSFATFFGGAAV